ncbi:MAG TPA: phosphate propanoyltransferase [Actinomycetota bacterium]|nr:phosphate propanoyltransferase [Actinomycetota bacterium]
MPTSTIPAPALASERAPAPQGNGDLTPSAPPICVDCGVCQSVRDWEGPDAQDLLRHLVLARVEDMLRGAGHPLPGARTIPIGVSARHIHLQPDHVARLFGAGRRLEPARQLLQPGEFATAHTVTVAGTSGRVLDRVRVLGPERPRTQIELSRTDAVGLGMEIPMRRSGDLAGTPAVTLIGPAGRVHTAGVIRAARHIHCSPEEAAGFGMTNGDEVSVRIPGPEGITFPKVLVRTHPGHKLIVHLDTDDANAAGVNCVTYGEVLISAGGR